MKLNEAREIVGYYVNGCRENPDFLTNVTEWEKVKEKLKTACRVLDDRSQIQEVHQIINKGDALFNKVVK